MKFTTDYHQNLSLLLKSGYPIRQANSLASKITRKIRAEAKKKFQQEIQKNVISILKE